MDGAQNEERRTRLRVDPDEGWPGEAVGFGPGCVRVACGIEDPQDLVEDFTRD